MSVSSRLLAALAYPRAVDDFIRLAAPLYAAHEVRARITRVKRETHDVATLVLLPNARWRGHRAGQHVALTAEVDGVRRTRCFSVASAESSPDGTIAVTVKARPNGAVTPSLITERTRGAIVTLSQASGDFVLPEVVPERLLLVSGGSGITPVMAILRTLLLRRDRRPRDVTFLHYARSPADVIYASELSQIARDAPCGVRVLVLTKMFERADLDARVPDFERWDTWACGPEPFLAAVEHTFNARAAAERVRVERFSLAPGSSKGESTQADGSVTFVRSKRRAKGSGPLLAMAEAAGLAPSSGCRMGICKTCLCRKLSGVTRDLRTGELSTDADVDIQLCVSAPVGAVAIDL